MSWASVVSPHVVYVGITSRAEFDKLALPSLDHRTLTSPRAVLVKSIEADGVTVAFQHWLDETATT